MLHSFDADVGANQRRGGQDGLCPVRSLKLARAATYEDLRAEGEALRVRLRAASPAGPPVEGLVREVRVWQLRCAVAVAVRTPPLVTEFCSRAGALQELAGHGWTPTPGWEPALAGLISAWLGAIDWAERPGAAG